MTTRPRLVSLDRTLLPGLVAVALFLIMAGVFLSAEFSDATGFAGGVSIVSGIGYALLGDAAAAGTEAVFEETENFLVALLLIAVLLDAALDGSLMLASRDEGGDSE